MTAKTNAVTEFDLDAFLGGAKVPTKTVKVYTDGPALVRLSELQDALKAARSNTPAAGSWGDPAGSGNASSVEDEISKVRASLDASAVTFQVRSLDSDDGDELMRRYPEKRDATDQDKRATLQKQIVGQMAVQIVGPRVFTEPELVRVRKAIGEPEFTRLWQACLDVNQEITVDSPFSRGSFGDVRSS